MSNRGGGLQVIWAYIANQGLSRSAGIASCHGDFRPLDKIGALLSSGSKEVCEGARLSRRLCDAGSSVGSISARHVLPVPREGQGNRRIPEEEVPKEKEQSPGLQVPRVDRYCRRAFLVPFEEDHVGKEDYTRWFRSRASEIEKLCPSRRLGSGTP